MGPGESTKDASEPQPGVESRQGILGAPPPTPGQPERRADAQAASRDQRTARKSSEKDRRRDAGGQEGKDERQQSRQGAGRSSPSKPKDDDKLDEHTKLDRNSEKSDDENANAPAIVVAGASENRNSDLTPEETEQRPQSEKTASACSPRVDKWRLRGRNQWADAESDRENDDVAQGERSPGRVTRNRSGHQVPHRHLLEGKVSENERGSDEGPDEPRDEGAKAEENARAAAVLQAFAKGRTARRLLKTTKAAAIRLQA